jgi:hypothetical protein
MGCPGFEDLIAFVDGGLASESAGLVAQHIGSGCRYCDANIGWYKRVKMLAANDDSTEPPAWVLKRALRIVDESRRVTARNKRSRKSIASLVFDSLARQHPAGVRSTATEQRQLLYTANGYSIDLQVAPVDGVVSNLIGQILFEGESGFESVQGIGVGLALDGVAVASTATNSIGEFSIQGLGPGDYDLSIEADKGTIIVPRLPMRLA